MKYAVLTGINYTPKGAKADVRREAGEEVSDLTPAQVTIYLKKGAIAAVEGT